MPSRRPRGPFDDAETFGDKELRQVSDEINNERNEIASELIDAILERRRLIDSAVKARADAYSHLQKAFEISYYTSADKLLSLVRMSLDLESKAWLDFHDGMSIFESAFALYKMAPIPLTIDIDTAEGKLAVREFLQQIEWVRDGAVRLSEQIEDFKESTVKMNKQIQFETEILVGMNAEIRRFYNEALAPSQSATETDEEVVSADDAIDASADDLSQIIEQAEQIIEEARKAQRNDASEEGGQADGDDDEEDSTE